MNNLAYKILNILFASIWLVNGLICKVLNFVPRHEAIVGEILGTEYSSILIKLIGISEIVMSIWILSKWQSRLNAIVQISAIFTMNILEFTLAPHLLLWGKFNLCFAIGLCILIYINEFHLKPKNNVSAS